MAWVTSVRGATMVALVSTSVIAGATVAGAATFRPQGMALGNNGATLVTMADLNDPSAVTGLTLREAGAITSLDALAYRPRTNQLYGYRGANSTVYLVDAATGALTPVAKSTTPINVAEVGFDFNNLIDAARLVSTADDNQVFFLNNMPPNVAAFTKLGYGAADVNAGVDPSIFANAYTNQIPFPTGTVQFVLDAGTDSLATLANNTGVLSTVGKITLNGAAIDFTSTGGFDIYSAAEGDNTAYALLSTAGAMGLYRLDLVAGQGGTVAATYIGATGGAFGALDSLAVVPALVPVPAAFWLLGSVLAGLGLMGRRRRAA